jgi:hypothetical protein
MRFATGDLWLDFFQKLEKGKSDNWQRQFLPRVGKGA